ncbi:MAG: DUF2628 domain-containing protein [Hyphomicrobium sp.]
MRDYTVHEPPVFGATRDERAEGLVFVKDGFSWGAALLGPFYFIARGEWLGLAAYIGAALVLRLAFYLVGAEPDWTAFAFLIFNVVAGFEANELKRLSLGYGGYREIGATSGRNHAECERRFIEAWLPNEPKITPDAWKSSTPRALLTIEAVEERLRSLAARLRNQYAPKA